MFLSLQINNMSICFIVRHILTAVIFICSYQRPLKGLPPFDIFIIAHLQYNASTFLEIFKNIFLLIFHST